MSTLMLSEARRSAKSRIHRFRPVDVIGFVHDVDGTARRLRCDTLARPQARFVDRPWLGTVRWICVSLMMGRPQHSSVTHSQIHPRTSYRQGLRNCSE
jgi:hypothetical protein